MGFLDKLRQLFAGGPPEEPLAPLMRELDEGQYQLFLEYEQRREKLEFAEATAALQSLLARDDNEEHKEFYRYLIEEMRIYLQKPSPEPQPTPRPYPPVTIPSKEGGSPCIFGMHKWGRWIGTSQSSSNVTDWKRTCARCGKVQRKVKPWKAPRKGRWD